jgi:glycosyltransferase involved in cell wall biosynthesis
MADARDVSVVIPAMNEAAAIAGVVTALAAAAPWREILVVDDGSTDETGARAAAAGARVIRHPYRKGNGAAVKSGIRQATGEYLLIIDGDGQHQPADAMRLVARLGEHDLVVGARAGTTQATSTRRLGNWFLNRLAGFLTERDIPDLTSGFRAARRACLQEFLHLLPNGFSTPTTTTLAFLRAGYNVAFEPVEARPRQGESKIRLSKDGPKFFFLVLRVVTIFSPLRVFLPIAGSALAAGVAYGAWTFLYSDSHRIANGAVILIMFGVIVFLVGLVSDQISALRFDGRR